MDPATGSLTRMTGHPLEAGEAAEAIAMHPSGRYLYVGVGTFDFTYIVAYAIDPTNGALAPIPGSPFRTGILPRDIAVDPSGAFLYVSAPQQSISLHAIDQTTGALVGHTSIPTAPGYATVLAILK